MTFLFSKIETNGKWEEKTAWSNIREGFYTYGGWGKQRQFGPRRGLPGPGSVV